ncbi:MAG: ABC transporter substrate-binding protein [Burkholderiaceae bacterium]|nr:MAG: ABC transporter substrate-binding protein [Burkholderiaceae bacterium]
MSTLRADAESVLHFLSAGAAKGVVMGVAERFQTQAGYRLEGEFGAVGAMRERFAQDQECDFLILSQRHIDELSHEGRLDPKETRLLGVVRTGVARRAQDPDVSVHDADALMHTLTQAPEIYFPDPHKSTAGIHFARVLATLGLDRVLAGRLRPRPNGAAAMREMALVGARGAIGCTQITEILYTPGVSLVAPLPARFGLATVYAAAIPEKPTHNTMAARRFVELLTGTETRTLRIEAGFDEQ